jgi:uncharacterized membrane protein YkvA (DUF1232 family)
MRMWTWQQAAAWRDMTALTRHVLSQEESLRGRIWRKLLREAASLPLAEELLTAHYCAFDRQTPLYVKLVLVGAIAYFALPDELMARYVPLIRYADDAAVLATAVKAVSAHIKPEHRRAAQDTLARLRA